MTIETVEKTLRGFDIVRFKDQNNVNCSVQKSSLAFTDAVWIGVDDRNPIIMASEAQRLGIQTTKTCGWIPYPIPEEVFITTSMHLTREHVRELLPYLKKFVETGELV